MPFFKAAFILYGVAFVCSMILAFRNGSTDERNAASIFLATSIGSQLVVGLGQGWGPGVEYGILSLDVALFGGLLFVVYRSKKFWPLWAASAALVGAITHGARWLRPSLAVQVYATIQPFWAIPVLIAITVGSYRNMINRN